jgi:cytochrome b
MSHRVRVWDLPTRLFHWSLFVCIVALVVTAKLGGNAMVWHFRLGHAVLALLLFRLLWGFVGGHWSRFGSFLHSPRALLRHVRGAADRPSVGHSPLGALSVFALLAVLALQVASGLVSDDEIAFAGPLTRFLPSAIVSQATAYHKDWGQWLVIALVLLHVVAVLFYLLFRRQNLIRPMLDGDKQLHAADTASRDDAPARVLALVLAAGCAAIAYGVWGLGN